MLLLFAAALAGCAEDDPPGIRVELQAPARQQRPTSVVVYWLTPREVLFERRVPEKGNMRAEGDLLGSVFIATQGPLAEARALVVRGERDGAVVSGGSIRVDPSMDARRTLQLRLGEPLPDQDDDRQPDLVENNCLAAGAPLPCASPPQPGPDARPPTGDGPGPDPDAGPTEAGAERPVPPDGALPDGNPEGPVEPPGDGGAPDVNGEAGTPNPALSVGLVAHWRFDEAPGATSARDSSGNMNHGTLVGIAPAAGWVAGRIGGALEIPNSNGNGVTVPSNPSFATIRGAFTIAAWIRRQATHDNGLAAVLCRRAANTDNEEYFCLGVLASGQLRGYINTQEDPNPPGITSNPTIPLNQWVHVAMSYDSTNLRLYINAAEVARQGYTQPIVSGEMPLCLGCGMNRPELTDLDEPLRGRLDELVLYNRALPPGEIALLHAGQLPVGP